jgi:hypothetical protein
MHFKWLRWLTEAARDSKIEQLIKRRKDTKISIFCLQRSEERALINLAIVRAHLSNLRATYHEYDAELAEIDGRKMICVLEAESKADKDKAKVKKALKKLSSQQRIDLMVELLKMDKK